MALSPDPRGFTSSELAAKVRGISGSSYAPRQAAYDLKKLRGKNFVRRIRRTRRYEATACGLRTLAALIVLREKVIKPVLAGTDWRKGGRPSKRRSELDEHYRCLQEQLLKLLKSLRIAA